MTAPAAKPPARDLGLLPLLVIVATLIAYWPVRESGFVRWDEQLYVTENPFLVEPDGLRKAWTTLRETERQYAPLLLTTYWIQHRLWGDKPAGYHAVNVWFHLCNGVLVLFVLTALGAGRWVATMSALLFTLHPIQVESVAWVAELKNLQMGFFYLAAFLFYLYHRSERRPSLKGWAVYGAMLILYACALLSKVAAITLPLSLFLADWLLVAPRDQRWWRGSLVRLAPMLVMGVAPALIAVGLEEGPSPEAIPSIWLRPLVAAAAVWFYLGTLLLPIDLIPIYPRWELSAGVLWLLGAAIALGAAAALLWRWRVRVDRLALWGLGHFLVSLLPILGLVPFGYMDHSFVADHFVYVAAVGVFLALAVVIERAVHNRPVRRWVAAGIAGLVLIGCVVLIRAQLPIWRDPLSFWSYLAAHNPRSDTVHNNLGNAYLRQNQLEEAVRHYRQALQIKPNSSLAQMNLGTVFHQQGRLREAIDHYRLAIDYQPESWLAHYNLALAYAETGQSEEAVREAEQAVAFARKRGRTPEAAAIEAWIADMAPP